MHDDDWASIAEWIASVRAWNASAVIHGDAGEGQFTIPRFFDSERNLSRHDQLPTHHLWKVMRRSGAHLHRLRRYLGLRRVRRHNERRHNVAPQGPRDNQRNWNKRDQERALER